MAVDATVPGLWEPGDRARLEDVLDRARSLGFLGPGPVGPQVDRSLALCSLLEPHSADRCTALDLGSGGGLPGLVLATVYRSWRWTLLDGSTRRTAWLIEAVTLLELGDTVEVLTARAEEAGRGPRRATYDVVVARGFAAPAPTAECSAPFLRVGGRLVVTEPPGGDPVRWPDAVLAGLGLRSGARMVEPVAAQVLEQVAPCPDRYPRRLGVPVKRPLW